MRIITYNLFDFFHFIGNFQSCEETESNRRFEFLEEKNDKSDIL